MNAFRALLLIVVAAGLAAALPATGVAAYQAGSCGPGVVTIQRTLNAAHYPTGSADGCFGSATRHGVLAFQRAQRLKADGIVGPQTLAALRKPRPLVARRAGNHVEVDRARQLLFVVRGGKVAAAYAVSTGKRGFATPSGNFRVYRKQVRGWSYQYAVPLPWVSYFHRGYALHAGTIPGYPASHGCVRVPAPFAPDIYRRTPIGSSVWIY